VVAAFDFTSWYATVIYVVGGLLVLVAAAEKLYGWTRSLRRRGQREASPLTAARTHVPESSHPEQSPGSTADHASLQPEESQGSAAVPAAPQRELVAADPAVENFAIGLAQALMAVRDAVDHFDRAGVLLDPVDWSLEEYSAELLYEGTRTTEEVEARLPRLRLRLGAASAAAIAASEAVESLRATLSHLRSYIRQPEPGEGQAWSEEELDAAKVSLNQARELEGRFLAAVA
jgi:hypothetical protein